MINIEYLRVTEVLAPFSGLSSIPLDILQAAAERGTKVHEICDSIIQGLGEFGVEEHLEGYINSFIIWKQGKKFIPKCNRWYCDELGITGECDAICESQNGLVLVDFKTSSRESKTWPLQGSAYAYLARKNGYDIKRIEFVKFSKEGDEPEIFVYEDCFDLFLKCLEVYRLFFKKKKESQEAEMLLWI